MKKNKVLYPKVMKGGAAVMDDDDDEETEGAAPEAEAASAE